MARASGSNLGRGPGAFRNPLQCAHGCGSCGRCEAGLRTQELARQQLKGGGVSTRPRQRLEGLRTTGRVAPLGKQRCDCARHASSQRIKGDVGRQKRDATQQLDEVARVLARQLPRRVWGVVGNHQGHVSRAKSRRDFGHAGRLRQHTALAPQRFNRLAEQHHRQLVAGRTVVGWNPGQGLEQNLGRAKVVDFRQRCHGLVAEFPGQALSGQERDVHQAVLRVIVLALDVSQLFVGQAAELIFDGARRLIEQDPHRRAALLRGRGGDREPRRGEPRDTTRPREMPEPAPLLHRTNGFSVSIVWSSANFRKRSCG